jgi:hypothetical protein
MKLIHVLDLLNNLWTRMRRPCRFVFLQSYPTFRFEVHVIGRMIKQREHSRDSAGKRNTSDVSTQWVSNKTSHFSSLFFNPSLKFPEYRTHTNSEALQTKIISERREQATCVYNPAALKAKRKSLGVRSGVFHDGRVQSLSNAVGQLCSRMGPRKYFALIVVKVELAWRRMGRGGDVVQKTKMYYPLQGEPSAKFEWLCPEIVQQCSNGSDSQFNSSLRSAVSNWIGFVRNRDPCRHKAGPAFPEVTLKQ